MRSFVAMPSSYNIYDLQITGSLLQAHICFALRITKIIRWITVLSHWHFSYGTYSSNTTDRLSYLTTYFITCREPATRISEKGLGTFPRKKLWNIHKSSEMASAFSGWQKHINFFSKVLVILTCSDIYWNYGFNTLGLVVCQIIGKLCLCVLNAIDYSTIESALIVLNHCNQVSQLGHEYGQGWHFPVDGLMERLCLITAICDTFTGKEHPLLNHVHINIENIPRHASPLPFQGLMKRK